MTYDKFCIFLTIITVWDKPISKFNLTACHYLGRTQFFHCLLLLSQTWYFEK